MRKKMIAAIDSQLPEFKDTDSVLKPIQKKQTRKCQDLHVYRGSHYRGVSINGGKWQVFMIVKNKKFYVGQMQTEEEAAALYDKLAILHSGLEAKTNFSYTCSQVSQIVDWYKAC